MNEKPVIKSKYTAFPIIGRAFIILLLCIAIFLLLMAFNGPKADADLVIAASIIFALILFPLYKIFTLKRIVVYEDYILLYNLWGKGKKVVKTDITHWAEKIVDSKRAYDRSFCLYFPGGNISVSNNVYANYLFLKSHLTQNLPDKSELRQKRYERKLVVVAASITGFLLLLFWVGCINSMLSVPETIRVDETFVIKDVVTHKPVIDNPARGSSSVTIMLKAFSQYRFRINDIAYHATYVKDFKYDVEIGDTLYLTVLQAEFDETEKEKDDSSGFWAKPETYAISVVGLRSDKGEYLTINGYNREIIADHNLVRYFFILLLGLTILFFIQLRKSWKKAAA